MKVIRKNRQVYNVLCKYIHRPVHHPIPLHVRRHNPRPRKVVWGGIASSASRSVDLFVHLHECTSVMMISSMIAV